MKMDNLVCLFVEKNKKLVKMDSHVQQNAQMDGQEVKMVYHASLNVNQDGNQVKMDNLAYHPLVMNHVILAIQVFADVTKNIHFLRIIKNATHLFAMKVVPNVMKVLAFVMKVNN
ncbi:hypothetical protein IMG5_070080 [Ichthyophthirius multifiliis]|uniref:Uncharacterized protein n=1 Tax=Ichthyophthirius multifiliis TaxID=5932 RepID=G0QPP8_ICHMU|nr:hypothetical protein IMG5_070080 [Ichthyophthirius multifiliis]EGR32809.1 hypothetical protein IMG5_070080 [Ichthyophthirius multifiliis]|eukprot:XP_004036795.1 hypothetical protein IMG5_070080 [Ichthyophthirius multifiliis]